MKKFHFIFYIVLFTTVFSGCTTNSAEDSALESETSILSENPADNDTIVPSDLSLPDWVLNIPREDDYIFGIGCDADLAAAKQKALINTGQQFNTTIKSILIQDGNDSFVSNQQFTECLVKGTKIYEQYQDDEQWWVLARTPLKCSLDVAESLVISYLLEIKQETSGTAAVIDKLGESVRETNSKPLPNQLKTMVLVQGGTFIAGTDSGELNEKPAHEISVDKFMISRHETTQEEWFRIMSELPEDLVYGRGDRHPVYNISWEDAVEFCNILSIRDGFSPCYQYDGEKYICNFNSDGYRLPTEAEWEYAARGGMFSADNINHVPGWHNANSGSAVKKIETTNHNSLGLYDMSGNVWEYCWDWYGPYEDSNDSTPKGPDSREMKVIRGGAWDSQVSDASYFSRGRVFPDDSFPTVGFRLARSVRQP